MSIHDFVQGAPIEGPHEICQMVRGRHSGYTPLFTMSPLYALIFRADVGSVALHGVDYLRMTPDGLVAEFHVMVRPLGALTALERAVTERMRSAGTPPQ